MLWEDIVDLSDLWEYDLDFPFIYSFILNFFCASYICVEYYCPNFFSDDVSFFHTPTWWSYVERVEVL